ncbi:MAG: CopD family protein, partial [Solirubrobacterales bacterium]
IDRAYRGQCRTAALVSVDTAIRSLHLICAAIWAGGLVFLGASVGVIRATIPEGPQRIALFRALGRRFLLVGGIAMLVLIATGTDMATDRLASWSDLSETDYGKRLSDKLALVVVVIALTLFHSLVQGPALTRLRTRALETPDDPELAATIRRKSIRAGIVNGLVLLCTLGILVLAARLVSP